MHEQIPLLELKGICKSFPGVKALDNVDFNLQTGEVHALLGENGAGKSTLMKIISGVYQEDAGDIILSGEKVKIDHPRQARELGIGIIHQELQLVPGLTVMENMFLGREPRRAFGMINWSEMKQKAQAILAELGSDIDPEAEVYELSIGQQQMVEIAKALSYASKILIMDEPTAALTESETENLFLVVKKLQQRGLGIVYISHRMEELFQLSQRVTVMRDGRYIGTVNTETTTFDELIRMMVGRELSARFPKEPVEIGEEVLLVKNLNRKGILADIQFSLRRGEILGVAGLMGSGRSELARAIFGADSKDSGSTLIDGKQIVIQKPSDAIREGIGFITEDRKGEGLVLGLSVKENISLANLKAVAAKGVISDKGELQRTEEYVQKLKIRTPGAEQIVGFLSGGNQQKVVIAKWLATHPKVLIMDEPTRGVDVGAKAEIYAIMNMLVRQGVGILMISSELPEILGMSDRVLVMNGGRVVADLPIEEASQEIIMTYAAGGQGGEVKS